LTNLSIVGVAELAFEALEEISEITRVGGGLRWSRMIKTIKQEAKADISI